MIMIDTSFLTALLNKKEKDYKLAKQNFLINYPIKSLKGENPNTTSTKYANYRDFLQKSTELELFLISTFDVGSKCEDLISFIINNNLLDIIKELPDDFEEYFDTLDLEIHLENKWNDEKWIVVKVFTNLDGESASNKLDLIEDKLFEKYQDDFLDNILLSVEFK